MVRILKEYAKNDLYKKADKLQAALDKFVKDKYEKWNKEYYDEYGEICFEEKDWEHYEVEVDGDFIVVIDPEEEMGYPYSDFNIGEERQAEVDNVIKQVFGKQAYAELDCPGRVIVAF